MKGCYSEGSLYRRVVIQKDRYSEKNQEGRYSEKNIIFGITTLQNNDPYNFFGITTLRNNDPYDFFGKMTLQNNDPSE